MDGILKVRTSQTEEAARYFVHHGDPGKEVSSRAEVRTTELPLQGLDE